MSEAIKHSGVKGMHWGVRKENLQGQARSRTQKFGNRLIKEHETQVALVGLGAIGVAYVRSPRARAVMKVPASAAYHYMAKAENRRKVSKVLKNSYGIYSKL